MFLNVFGVVCHLAGATGLEPFARRPNKVFRKQIAARVCDRGRQLEDDHVYLGCSNIPICV